MRVDKGIWTNKLENGNWKSVKPHQRAENSRTKPNGLQDSDKIPQPEACSAGP